MTGIVRGGPLEPPGPPGPTDGVMLPGTAISSLPYTISQPGNYYVTRNLTGTGAGNGIGINITTVGVVLDLGGFTLDGANLGSVGISSTSGFPSGSITVRNGNIERWSQVGMEVSGASIEHVSVSSNHAGIRLNSGVLTNCSVRENTERGVAVEFSIVSDCSSFGNGTGFWLNASSLTGCSADYNTSFGIDATRATISDCIIYGSSTGARLSSSSLHDCMVWGSSGTGIDVTSSIVEGCAIEGNVITGMLVGAGSIIRDNRISDSQNYGMQVTSSSSTITGNVIESVGLGGMLIQGGSNRIESNHVVNTGGYGILVNANGHNTIVLNTARGNISGNYSIGAGNDAGPVTTADSTTNTSEWSNISSP